MVWSRFEGHFGGFHPTEPHARARRPGNAGVPPANGTARPPTDQCGRDARVPRTPCPRAFARGVPGENPTAHMPHHRAQGEFLFGIWKIYKILPMSAAWGLQTRSGAVRLSPVPIPLPPSCAPLEPRPFPPPALPRFPGTTGLSATPNGPACPSQAAGGHAPYHRRGFPCCVHPPPPCVPPPLPRRNRSVLVSLASRPMTAFPVSQAGRLPHHPFRGLLGVHSRCGPQGRRVAFATRFIGVLRSIRTDSGACGGTRRGAVRAAPEAGRRGEAGPGGAWSGGTRG